jgi:hypothetical protein
MKLQKLILILMLGLLTACSTGGSSPTAAAPATGVPGATLAATRAAGTPPATPAAATASALPPTATAAPLPGKVLLVAPPEAGTDLANSARTTLAGLAAAANLAFETRPGLLPEELKPEFKVIVLLQAPQNLPALLAGAPQAQFAVLGGSELEPKGNLSVIRQREEVRAFLAGYILTLITPDWRALGLLPDAPPALQEAFINGGRYWCGRCVPHYAPMVLFPVATTQPAGTTLAGWKDAFTQLHSKNVLQSVYVAPQANSPELLKALVNQNIIVVGTSTPGAEVQGRYAASVVFNPAAALKKLWPDLLAGKGSVQVPAVLTWADVNEAYFTAGKQRLAEAVVAGLADGTIGPLSVP